MQNNHQILFFLALHLSVRQFQMPLERLSLQKEWQRAKFLMQPIHLYKILLAKDSLSLLIHLEFLS